MISSTTTFDDYEPENIVFEKSWKKKIEDLNKEGYREGLDVGKGESVQEGFNEAFEVAAKTLFRVAKLRGNISGRLSMNLLKPGTLRDETETQLQDLLQKVCTLESQLLTFSETTYTQIRQNTVCRSQTLQDVKTEDLNVDAGAVKKDRGDCIEKHTVDTDDVPEYLSDTNNKNNDDIERLREIKISKKYTEADVSNDREETEIAKGNEICTADTNSGREDIGVKGGALEKSEVSQDCDSNVESDRDTFTQVEDPFLKRLEALAGQYKAIVS